MTNTTKHTGSKYWIARDLDVAEIAKLIRKDLKKAGFRASVRISRYSMGRSINVEIKALPKTVDLADAVVWQGYPKGHSPTTYGEYTGPECINETGSFHPVKGAAVEIVDSYNDRESDSQTDYYRSNFHGSVTFSHELKAAAIEAAVAKLANAPRGQVEMLASLGI